jgi:hypothetical protein
VTAPTWAPTTAGVALHIPSRTRQVGTDDSYAYDFTVNTTPTNTVGVQLVDRACTKVLSVTGTPIVTAGEAGCALAAELWAAYWVELGFPERDGDVQVYDQIRKDAEAATAAAAALNTAAGGGTDNDPTPGDTALVVASFPPAQPWADVAPGIIW